MPDPEGKDPKPEPASSSAAEETTPFLKEVPEHPAKAESKKAPSPISSSETETSKENAVGVPSKPAPPKVTSPEPAPPQKLELKKHVSAVPNGPPPAVEVAPEDRVPDPATPVMPAVPLKKEIAAHLPETGLEIEISFVLDRKKISLAALSTLAEGEVMTLSGADFKTTLFLQDKAIAEAELIMVDQRPAVQITKVFNAS